MIHSKTSKIINGLDSDSTNDLTIPILRFAFFIQRKTIYVFMKLELIDRNAYK